MSQIMKSAWLLKSYNVQRKTITMYFKKDTFEYKTASVVVGSKGLTVIHWAEGVLQHAISRQRMVYIGGGE